MNKKNIIPVALLLILLSVGFYMFYPKKASDGNKDGDVAKQNPYKNEDLGFSLSLPADFGFYTTQRKDSADFIDIEFFVPSGDTSLYQQISGYAKPVVVRIVKNEEYIDNGADRESFVELGRKDGKVYTVWLWNETPRDWQGKWGDSQRKDIIESFKIN